MLKHFKPALLIGLICLLFAGFILSHPTFATESKDVTETVFFGNVEDDGSACGVFTVLNLVVDILSIGIGILGVIGITVVVIKYLSAKDNEEQTRKAKHRMLQIVIGLATAALLYTGLQFLLPGGKLSFTTECKTISDKDLQAIKDKEKAEAEEKARNSTTEPGSSSSSSSSSKSKSSKNKANDDVSLEKWFKAMKDQYEYMKNGTYGSNYKSNFKLSKTDYTCITFPSTSLQRLGLIPKNTYVWYNCGMVGTAKKAIKKRKDVFKVLYPNKTAKQLNKKGKIKKGDIVFYQYGSTCGVGHVMVFMGFNKQGKPIFNTFGHIGGKLNYAHPDGSRQIKMIIRLKKTSL